jgi:hypothetical protein
MFWLSIMVDVVDDYIDGHSFIGFSPTGARSLEVSGC